MEDNIVNIFKNKTVIPEGQTADETIAKFHSKLDEVMDTFQQLSVMEKFEIVESVVTMNKNIFTLYMDLRKRHEFHMNNY